MSVALQDYQEIRRAVLRLPEKQRLQLINEAILTLSIDEQALTLDFDFDATLKELHNAFAKADTFTDKQINEARYTYLIEKYDA